MPLTSSGIFRARLAASSLRRSMSFRNLGAPLRRATGEIARTRRVRSNTPDFPAELRASWTIFDQTSGALPSSGAANAFRILAIAAGGSTAPSCRKSNWTRTK